MPLILKKTTSSGAKLGLWRITEDREELLSKIHHLSDIPTAENKRSLQWMAARATVLELIDNPKASIMKDTFGKPHLVGIPDKISITHCGDYAAAVISDDAEMGIDLEKLSDRINRVGHKFASHSELDLFSSLGEIEGLHIIWGVKECLYKMYGRKEIDFKANFEVQNYIKEESCVVASINKGPFSAQVKLQYEYHAGLLLVYTIESI
jgi:4'-phosphopantetheinyl transferase